MATHSEITAYGRKIPNKEESIIKRSYMPHGIKYRNAIF
jgi:hypothetical protein